MERLFDLSKFDSNIALIEGDNTYTYSDLEGYSDEIAHKIGVRTLCMIMTTNTYASVAGYVGCLNNGIVPILIDSHLHQDMIMNLLELYRPPFVWCPSKAVSKFGEGYTEIYSSNEYTLLGNGSNDCEMYDDLALLITTSGSTGSPKLVRQSYKNIEANTKSIVSYLEITSEERGITSLPMNYVYGLSVLNTHLYTGASIVLTSLNCYTPKFWKHFNEKEATSFSGVPFMYEMINKLDVMNSVELPTLKTMTQAGGKLSVELHEKFAGFAHDTGRKFVVMYGASEATARMGYLPAKDAVQKMGSMGIAIPGGRFELIDEEGNVIEDSEKVGELVYYGDNVTLGYALSGKDLIKGDENEGRLITGDMAKRDADGYYYVVGRKKRFVKMVGKRLNLDELEAAIKKEFQITDVACAGIDDKLNVFITDKQLEKSVNDFVFGKIGLSRGLYKTVTIDEIPKNPSGKTMYAQLKIQ